MRGFPLPITGFAQKVTGPVRSGLPREQRWLVLLRAISCNFVDRVPGICGHTIHEVTPSYLKEHEIRVFVQSPDHAQDARATKLIIDGPSGQHL